MSSNDPTPVPQPDPQPAEAQQPLSTTSEPMVPGPQIQAPPPPMPAKAVAPPRTEPGVRPMVALNQPGFKRPFVKGFGTGLGLTVGAGAVTLVLTIVSLLGVGLVGRALSGSAASVDNTMTTIWGPATASNSLLALNIEGTIDTSGGSSLYSSATYGYEIAEQLDALETDDYAGVMLLMDTPGGSISGSRAIADAVVRYQDRTGKKVVAYVQGTSASGGMYAMSPADLIISDYGTMIGSIGVIMGPFAYYRDVTGLTGTILSSGVTTDGGITQEYLTQGTGKDFGNPFREMTEQERAIYTNNIAIEYQGFVDYVSAHRDIPAERIVNELGAYMFDPQTAIELGLADEMMGRPEGFRRAAEFSGLDADDTKVVTPGMPGGLAQLLGVEARVFGHNQPLSSNDGLVPTSSICTGSPTPLAFAGDFTTVCGA